MEESEYMAKMRVHELAKELEIKSQEIIDSLSGTHKKDRVRDQVRKQQH